MKKIFLALACLAIAQSSFGSTFIVQLYDKDDFAPISGATLEATYLENLVSVDPNGVKHYESVRLSPVAASLTEFSIGFYEVNFSTALAVANSDQTFQFVLSKVGGPYFCDISFDAKGSEIVMQDAVAKPVAKVACAAKAEFVTATWPNAAGTTTPSADPQDGAPFNPAAPMSSNESNGTVTMKEAIASFLAKFGITPSSLCLENHNCVSPALCLPDALVSESSNGTVKFRKPKVSAGDGVSEKQWYSASYVDTRSTDLQGNPVGAQPAAEFKIKAKTCSCQQ